MDTGTAILPISARQYHLALIGGLPTSLTYLAADFCRDLMFRRHGACDSIVLNELGAETAEKVAAVSSPVVFLTEVPDAAVADLARSADFPIILIDQRFAAATQNFMAARSTALMDTIRTMMRCQLSLDALAEIPRARLLRPRVDEPASSLAGDLAAALALEAEIVESMVADRRLKRPLSEVLDEIFPYETLLADEEADDILGKLEPFYTFSSDAPPTMLEVPLAALIEGAPPHLPATGSIDLLGPARCLTFGPFFHLPKGRWRARFTFLTSENQTSNTLGFDITADQEIKVDETYQFDASGKYAFACEFEVDSPHSHLEFRTFLRRGSIEGKFRPLSLTIEQCPRELIVSDAPAQA